VWARIRSYWQGIFRRSTVEDDLAEEMRAHLAVRMARKTPGVTAVAILSLALSESEPTPESSAS
jgi:hypothetical protein